MATKMVRTPEQDIPIAEVESRDGHVYLIFKKPRSPQYEILTLDVFLHLVFAAAESAYWRDH